MTTLDDVLKIQNEQSILQAPTLPDAVTVSHSTLSAATSSTLQIALRNNTSSSNVWAYITGLDINKNSAVFLLQSDGVTGYYPSSPANNGTGLSANCHIQLGAPGTTRTVTVPQLAGGRIWFCRDNQLTFLLNPGPGLVEPSVTNPSDPNYNYFWDFAEFTFNSLQLFANITYVDFVSLPISLTLLNTSGATQTVPGLYSDGLDTVCSNLAAQTNKDGAGWSQLVVKAPSGANLRALSPNSGIVMNGSLFNGYYQNYVNSVWAKYATTTLTLDTQSDWGTLTGAVSNGSLVFGSIGSFSQPSAADIFNCSSGAFAVTSGEVGNIGARLAAAFNRSTLLINPNQPDGEVLADYYTDPVTNHYSRIVHAANPDGRGYAFPYDDVAPSDDANVAGTVADGSPSLLTVTVGGTSSTSKVKLREMARTGGHASQLVGGRRARVRRDLSFVDMSAQEEKAALAERDRDQGMTQVASVTADSYAVDLEKGQAKLNAEAGALIPSSSTAPATTMARSLRSLVPAGVEARAQALLERLENSPVYLYLKPTLDLLIRCLVMLLSLSVRSLVSRVAMVLFLVAFSFLLGFFGRGPSDGLAQVIVPGSALVERVG